MSSCVADQASWTSETSGSFFIESFCEIFSKHAHNTDVMKMLTMVRFNCLYADIKYHALTRAGTIRSAADTIRIRYGPCRYETYSILYKCMYMTKGTHISKSVYKLSLYLVTKHLNTCTMQSMLSF